MNDRLHKSIYGQALDEMKEDKGAWEYKKITNKDIIHKTIEDYVCNKETDTAKAQGMLNALRIMDEVLEQDNICDTCKHNDKEWDEEPCDGCCGNHSGYEPSGDKQTDRIEYGTDGNAYKLWMSNGKEYEPSGDLISRQAVKRILEDRFMELQKRHDDKRYETNYCLNTILDLPSVTPQAKTGYISIDDVMSVFDDFMCGEDEEAETFLEMLKDKLTESEDK